MSLLTCAPRQHVKTWHKLERALLLQFKDDYGRVPVCNTQGKNMVWRDEGIISPRLACRVSSIG